MFIYTIAYFLKFEMYDKVAYFLGKTYFDINKLTTYNMFYNPNHNELDSAVKIRDDQNYITGTGKLWIENIATNFCSKKDFVLADIICYNYYAFCEKTDLYMHWFPITYIYGYEQFGENILSHFANKLKIKEYLRDFITLFNFKNDNSFIQKYKLIENEYKSGGWRYRYPQSFEHIPILCDFVKSEEIGKYS